MIFSPAVNASQCRMMLGVGWGGCWRCCGFSLANRCCEGDDSAISPVRTTSVSVTFSPPDYRRAGSAARHPSEPVVPVPCGSGERARDERLHGTQQALSILERLVFFCHVWCSPSAHSHEEHNLVCLLLCIQQVGFWGSFATSFRNGVRFVWSQQRN